MMGCRKHMRHRNRPYRRRLYRSREDSVIAGVCGGIAEYFDLPSWGVRLAVVLISLTPVPVFIPYVIMALILKKNPEQRYAKYEDEQFWDVYELSRPDALRKVHDSYQALDRRLQRMESIVTSPAFELHDQLRNL